MILDKIREAIYIGFYAIGWVWALPGMIVMDVAQWLKPNNNEEENENL